MKYYCHSFSLKKKNSLHVEASDKIMCFSRMRLSLLLFFSPLGNGPARGTFN